VIRLKGGLALAFWLPHALGRQAPVAIGKIFKNGVVAANQLLGIFDRTAQRKADVVFTLPAQREQVSLKQRGLVHQAMRIMLNSVNAAFRNQFARKKYFLHLHPMQGSGMVVALLCNAGARQSSDI
jgi:hypothetical protein